MLGYIILGSLAAFGLLCGLWAAFGWLLPGGRGSVTVFLCRPGVGEDWIIGRYRWLQGLGLLHGPLLILGSGLSEQEQAAICQRHRGIEFCSLEALSARLEWEWEQLG